MSKNKFLDVLSSNLYGEVRIENGGTVKTIRIEKFSCIEHAEGKFKMHRDGKDITIELQ